MELKHVGSVLVCLGLAVALTPVRAQEDLAAKVRALEEKLNSLSSQPPSPEDASAKWRADIDKFASDLREICLKAESTDDLETAMVRASALQVQRGIDSRSSQNLLNQRASQKLGGAIATLESWAKYLDLKTAQNNQGSNAILRTLKSQTQYPILTIPEIESRMLQEEPVNTQAAIAKALEGVKTPGDVAAAINALKNLKVDPANGTPGLVKNELQRWDTLREAWEAVSKGDHETATRILQRNSPGIGGDSSDAYGKVRDQLTEVVIQNKIKGFSQLTRGEGEHNYAFLARVLDELHGKQEFAAMIEVMRIPEQLTSYGQRNEAWIRDRSALEKYLAAQRFETAGDFLAALTSYRQVVDLGSGKYVPAKAAVSALERLKAEKPDLFTDADNMVLEELRALRSMLMRSSPGRGPFPGPSR